MAKEIQAAHTLSGRTLYALIRNTTGSVWDTVGSSFVTYATADITKYDIALTEQGTASRLYAGDMPSLSAGVYHVTAFDRLGANPAETDPLVAVGSIHWNGSAVTTYATSLDAAGVRSAVGLASANLDTQLSTIDDFLDTEVAAIKAKTDLIPASPANEATLTTISGYLDTEIAAIKAKTDNLPASPAATGDAMTLESGERDSVAAALLDLTNGIETGVTVRQAQRLILAANAGKLSGAATTTITIRDVNDSKDRIVATVDSDGNRTAITTDTTP